jgi:thioredoxin reductase
MATSKIKQMKRPFLFGGLVTGSQTSGLEWNADIVVIGSGPAGLSAAIAAKAKGAKHVIVVERLQEIGGLLPQCIHKGFGMRMFGEELTGPEYARRLIQLAESVGVEFLTDAFVSVIAGSSRNPEAFTVHVLSPKFGSPISIESRAVILATGCRERPLGSISAPTTVTGTRPSGVFTAGTAQRMINIGGYRMGKRAVVLGSGDIGLIVARRLALTGTEVVAAYELSDSCGGMAKNRKQCLDAFNIPLVTKHTITELHGDARLEAVSVTAVDENDTPIAGSEFTVECDTLIVSVGLIPETELLTESSVIAGLTRNPGDLSDIPEGIFVCGNARKIEHMADDIADDGTQVGILACEDLSYINSR